MASIARATTMAAAVSAEATITMRVRYRRATRTLSTTTGTYTRGLFALAVAAEIVSNGVDAKVTRLVDVVLYNAYLRCAKPDRQTKLNSTLSQRASCSTSVPFG